MSEAWFNPNMWAWLPGALLGVVGGTFGSLAGWLAPKGKCRGLVLGGMLALIAICGVLLALGVTAYFTGQPYGVWYGLGLAGALGVTVIGINYPMIRNVYRQAEERKMSARDVPL